MAIPRPAETVASAAYAAYNNDATRSLNIKPIENLAQHNARWGVNTVWVSGSMGSFDAMTVAERKLQAEEWAKQGHKYGLYIVVQVGSTNQNDAIELAAHAKAIGVDAISVVPPYYQKPGTWDDAISFFQPIANAAAPLPFYYYHIPGLTGVNLPVSGLFARAEKLPTLAGVKYVDENWNDFLYCVKTWGSRFVWMWAPEPKLRWLPFRSQAGADIFLGESFFAPTFLRMFNHFKKGNMTAALVEQQWKDTVGGIFCKYGCGDVNRYLYRRLAGVDMGPPRPPLRGITEAQYTALVNDLDQFGFFTQQLPPYAQDEHTEL